MVGVGAGLEGTCMAFFHTNILICYSDPHPILRGQAVDKTNTLDSEPP